MLTEVVQCMSKLKAKARKQLQYVCVFYIYITVQDYDDGSPCHPWSNVLHGLCQSSRVRTW
jgi:hypothetical protein